MNTDNPRISIRVYPCLPAIALAQAGSSVVIFLFFTAVAHLSAIQAQQTNTAFSCIMHVHTRMSSGLYDLPKLTEIAKAQGVDVIFLSDNLVESIEFGLPPLRHIFWASRQKRPAVLTIGWRRCLHEIKAENERQKDVLYIPGVEVSPRFFWSGSLLKTNLVCHNHQRDLIIIGTENIPSLAHLPTTSGYRWGRHTVWIFLTRLLLALFIAGCLGMVFLPRYLARRSNPGYYPGLSYSTPSGCISQDANLSRRSPAKADGGNYTTGEIRRAFLFGLILPVILLMIAVNFLASMLPSFDIYGPDNPERFEQRVLDALKQKKLINFWAHPEAPDHSAFKYFGVPFTVDTRPYPEVLLKTKGYTGFAGVNEGENKFVDPGSIWDTLLKQYIDGQREEPVWCFGEMLYHYEGQAGKKLSNVETIVWAQEKTSAALLDSVRQGFFYARRNYAGQSLTLDQWRVNGLESAQTGQTTNGHVDISLRVNAKIPGEKAEVLIIRNGEVIKKAEMTVPFELRFRDEPPPGRACYYRALISGKYPVRLVTNPIFI